MYPKESGSQFMEEFYAPLYYVLLGKVKHALKSITVGKTRRNFASCRMFHGAGAKWPFRN